jgi:hypothetical protein
MFIYVYMFNPMASLRVSDLKSVLSRTLFAGTVAVIPFQVPRILSDYSPHQTALRRMRGREIDRLCRFTKMKSEVFN